MIRLAIALLVFGLVGGVVNGCGSNCETADPDEYVRYDGGTTVGDTYETAGWDDKFLYFPPGRRFVLLHGLGKTPTTVKTYLSFSEQADPDAGINRAESSGNQVVIERVDSEAVQVRNDTCAEFYLRVVATVGSPGDAGPTDAGAD